MTFSQVQFDDEFEETTKTDKVHLRVQQRTTNKYITIIEGMDKYSDNLKLVLKNLKHVLHINGVVKENIIQIQGDNRDTVKRLLKDANILENNIIVHGF